MLNTVKPPYMMKMETAGKEMNGITGHDTIIFLENSMRWSRGDVMWQTVPGRQPAIGNAQPPTVESRVHGITSNEDYNKWRQQRLELVTH